MPNESNSGYIARRALPPAFAAKRIEQQAKLAGWELTLDVESSVQPVRFPRKSRLPPPTWCWSLPAHRWIWPPMTASRSIGRHGSALQDPAALLDAARSGASVYRHEAAPAVAKPASGAKRIVAVTACPTGWPTPSCRPRPWETMAKQLGHQIRVETQARSVPRMP